MEKSERAKDGGSRRAERSIWGQGGREGGKGLRRMDGCDAAAKVTSSSDLVV